jgi:hypothetical protein
MFFCQLAAGQSKEGFAGEISNGWRLQLSLNSSSVHLTMTLRILQIIIFLKQAQAYSYVARIGNIFLG